jgi:oligopeptidase B
VLDYLNAENAYLKKTMAHTEEFQEALYEEIVERLKQDDETVPYFKNSYWYYTRFEEGQEYPIYCRKKDSLDGDEEIMLDANVMAEGHSFFSVSGLGVSPNNEILAFSEDTVGRRIYTTRFKNLKTGETLADEITNANPGIAWANDNSTFWINSNPSMLKRRSWSSCATSSECPLKKPPARWKSRFPQPSVCGPILGPGCTSKSYLPKPLDFL